MIRKLTLAGACLALLAAAAVAVPYDFSFRQGPDEMIILVDDFRQFHSELTNTGENAEAYTLNVTLDGPANWTFGVCYGGICYPPFQTEFRVPETGTLAPGESMEFDFDVFSLFDSGEGTYTVEFACESAPSNSKTYVFKARTPVEGRAMLFSVGEAVISAPVDGYVQFHPVFYNAGTVEDSYVLSVERFIPENWQAMFCVGGVCYPPNQESIELPVGGGTYTAGAAEPIDVDFATLFEAGQGSMRVTITSVGDPSLSASATFTTTTGSIVAVGDVPGASLVDDLRIAPNPFNPRAEIRFAVGGEVARDAVVDIFDARGALVRTLTARALAPGQEHALTWDGTRSDGQRAATGTYLARVSVGGTHQVAKMSLVK